MTRNATLQAGLYARVSQDKRKTGRSVDEQEAEGRAACRGHGWDLAGVYRDDDRSASRFARRDRPDWIRLLADLDAGRLDVLVIWEPSRGSRDLEDWAALLRRCRDTQTLIHVTSHDHTYDVRKARDWRALADDGVDSAYESEKTSLRIRRTKAAGAHAGRPDGRVPFGYERVYDPATRQLLEQRPDPQRAPVVREIFARVNRGDPISTISADLAARGAPAPTPGVPWERRTVRRVATSLAYIGKRRYQGEVLDGSWPPLVDEATFWAAQRVLSDPIRRTTRPGRAKHLLSYLAVCSVCAEPLYVANRRKILYYVCPAGHVGARLDWLDEYVQDVVLALLTRPDVYTALTRADDSAVLEARAEAERLRARMDDFRDSAAAGETSPSALAHVEAKLLPQIDAAERRATLAATPPQLRALLEPAGDVADRWRASTVAARKDVLRVLVESIALLPATRGRSAGLDPDRVVITPRDLA